jgi:multimeric flavodoxin WrbA
MANITRTLLVVQHSRTGGTLQMAQALADAARAAIEADHQANGAADGESASVTVRLLPASQAGPADLLAADAYVFATPENLAAVSGLMKDFFDRSYYPVLDRIQGRPCALLICAGTDGHSAARQIERITTGWRLRLVAPPLIVLTGAQTPEQILAAKHIGRADLERCRELGAALATGLALGIY